MMLLLTPYNHHGNLLSSMLLDSELNPTSEDGWLLKKLNNKNAFQGTKREVLEFLHKRARGTIRIDREDFVIDRHPSVASHNSHGFVSIFCRRGPLL